MDFLEGEVLYFDKPLQWTSFDVVNKTRYVLRRSLGVKKIKVGHAGTLDPLATGVMIVCTGKATKKIDSYLHQDKEYVATLKLGATTPSFDKETEENATFPIDFVTKELVEATLKKFVGEISQVPPLYSAIRVNGTRAYELARKNKDVEIEPRIVRIDKIELLEYNLPHITIKVSCSKGTYIRSLARDIGEELKCGAYLTALQRTKVGEVGLEDCITIEKFQEIIEQENSVL
ncbi:MAG: tRNA pseudouridine(55) synthase TruB [Bacteroidales bacterium]|nr:tRNA pseudouridine(55) synthase TruB [Bacteroidales bacterium]